MVQEDNILQRTHLHYSYLKKLDTARLNQSGYKINYAVLSYSNRNYLNWIN